ncbi:MULTISPECIES: putative holin-like toxin [Bacillaceae]|nr:putative holin-like toxin [Metabacillus dongyingensis]USK30976.1 putative holin-like toxin [Bacillus sp. CMF21]
MTIFESLVVMVSFATLIVAVLGFGQKK